MKRNSGDTGCIDDMEGLYSRSIFFVASLRWWNDWGGSWKYQRKNKVSSWIKYFAQCKRNVHPEARGNQNGEARSVNYLVEVHVGVVGGTMYMVWACLGSERADVH